MNDTARAKRAQTSPIATNGGSAFDPPPLALQGHPLSNGSGETEAACKWLQSDRRATRRRQ